MKLAHFDNQLWELESEGGGRWGGHPHEWFDFDSLQSCNGYAAHGRNILCSMTKLNW